MLIDELGVEPGPELRRLFESVLRADPSLRHAADGPRPARSQDAPADRATADKVVPRQLPAGAGYLAGRAAELRTLTRLLDEAGTARAAVISAVGGTAGIGKTTLAVHWARQVAGRFPGGQLYVNLRGYDPSGDPVTPAAAIRDFLAGLGVPPGQVPGSPDAQVALYRSLLADQQILVVLDNARDVAQVRPLLPGGPGCFVVVTSRNQLTGLAVAEGAHLLGLDVLSGAEGLDLLANRLGSERLAGEPESAAELVRLCAGLPLGLSIAAARAAARPGFPLSGVAAELRDAGRRLDALDAGDFHSSIRAVFSWSYQLLGAAAARMFRLLGLSPGPDISVAAASSLAEIPRDQAITALTELTAAHLLTECAPGRFAFHDLLRAYATEQAEATDDEAARRAARARVLGHYVHTGHAAAHLLRPSREPIAVAAPVPGATPEPLADQQQALAWCEAEQHVLISATALAANAGFDAYAWQLPWAMADFLDRRGRWHEQVAVQRTALDAATRLGDITGQAVACRAVAHAYLRLGDYDKARAYLEDCLELHRRLGDRAGEARVHQSLGWAAERQGRYADAVSHTEQALALFRIIDHQAGQADSLSAVGWCYALLGNYQRARTFCRQASPGTRNWATARESRTHGIASATPSTTSATTPAPSPATPAPSGCCAI